MKSITLTIFSFLTLLPSIAFADDARLPPFNFVPPIGEELSASFPWRMGNNNFHLRADGTLQAEHLKKKVQLPIRNGMVTKLLAQNYQGDLIIGYETDFGGEGSSYICRVKGNLSSIGWCQEILVFNLTASVTNDSILVGGIGFVARINPQSGKYIWRHDDLYKVQNGRDSFNITCPISDNGTVVMFDAGSTNGNNNKQITIERSSGKIINVSDSKSGQVCVTP